ncbi:helix-turn-helix domain-containing protein [uncultured Fusobacterium sp.]|uniref:helix-turn-helix domain-containing protein n=1 Tax=uncultured Fusobacterium sp. TaxID=159267 RepID=UPI0025F59D85|nr:helix-turn-helix domain-containing protein [uncultured Fusobacterium sp.]
MLKNLNLKPLDIDVINYILQNNSATIEELCSCFEVSQVNIRNVLAKVENFILEAKMGVLLKKNGSYFFENNNLNLDFDFKKFLSDDLEKKERIIYLILKMILENTINLSYISRELNISRITLNSDIEIIREMIKDFNLEFTSVQWRGVFFTGKAEDIQNFSIIFISKLYIEEYFSSNLKKVINPIVLEYFRNNVPSTIEKKIFNIANKLYQYFNIKLGKFHYFFLVGILTFMYLANKQGKPLQVLDKKPLLDLTEPLNDALELEDRELLGDNSILISNYLSRCVNKKYSLIFPFNADNIVEEIYSNFNLIKTNDAFEIFSFFINDIYFKNRFFIPNYQKSETNEKDILEGKTSSFLINLFNKYSLPFNKKDIIFLTTYIENISSKSDKKDILIIDDSSLNWKGNLLKEKLKYLEHVNSINLISFFNFKYFPIETFNKYQVFIFIDLNKEKNNIIKGKKCYYINSYDFIKNLIDLSKLI